MCFAFLIHPVTLYSIFAEYKLDLIFKKKNLKHLIIDMVFEIVIDANLQYSSNIILPLSFLDRLSRLDLPFPWTFDIICDPDTGNPGTKHIYASVLDFTSDERQVKMPEWMIKYLNLSVGDTVLIQPIVLPRGKLIKIQPQNPSFLNITDVKYALETVLRDYPVLTKDAIIPVSFDDVCHELLIMDIRDASELSESLPCIYTIDTDLEVDFETPLGYVEPLPFVPCSINIQNYIFRKSNTSPAALRLPPGMLYFGYPTKLKELLK